MFGLSVTGLCVRVLAGLSRLFCSAIIISCGLANTTERKQLMIVHDLPDECFNAPVFNTHTELATGYPSNFSDDVKTRLHDIIRMGRNASWCIPDYIVMTRPFGFKDSQTKITTSIESKGDGFVRVCVTVVNPFGDTYFTSMVYALWTQSVAYPDGYVLNLQSCITQAMDECLRGLDCRRSINVIHVSEEYDDDGMICLLPRFLEDSKGDMTTCFDGNRNHLPGSVHRRKFGWQNVSHDGDLVNINGMRFSGLHACQLLSYIEADNMECEIELYPNEVNARRIMGLSVGRVLI